MRLAGKAQSSAHPSGCCTVTAVSTATSFVRLISLPCSPQTACQLSLSALTAKSLDSRHCRRRRLTEGRQLSLLLKLTHHL